MTSEWDAKTYELSFSFIPELGRDLVELLQPVAGKKILDLGCGSGVLTADIARKGASVVQNAYLISRARQNYPNLTFVEQDAHQLALIDSFDAVFSNAALHWMDVSVVFPLLYGALRTGGRLVAELGITGNFDLVRQAIGEALRSMGLNEKEFPLDWNYATIAYIVWELEKLGIELRYALFNDSLVPIKPEANGIIGLIKVFCPDIVDNIPPQLHAGFYAELEKAGRPALFHNGQWHMDYRRFRFMAVKLP